jgi:hypothetical protein
MLPASAVRFRHCAFIKTLKYAESPQIERGGF